MASTSSKYTAEAVAYQQADRARALNNRTASDPARSNSKLHSQYESLKYGGDASSAASRGRAAALKAEDMADLRGTKHPLGHPEHPVTLNNEPSQPRITGHIKKFRPRIAPSSFGMRTGWKISRTHHFKKRLHIRKPRMKSMKGWRRTRHRLTPK
jgi:hypothetical protein